MGDLSVLLERYLLKLAECVDSKSKRTDCAIAADLIVTIQQSCLCYPFKENDKANICAQVFSQTYGVVVFLRSMLGVQGSDECSKLKCNVFRFLDNFLDLMKTSVIPYGPEIKEVCVVYMKQHDGTATLKKAALVTLSKVLELCHNSDVRERMHIKNLIEDLYMQLTLRSKLQPTVKENVLCILGTISHYYPEDFDSYSDRMLMVFLQELQSQMNSKAKKLEASVVIGCLLGLKEHLFNFSVSCTEDASKSSQIFDYAKRAAEVGEKNYSVCKAGLQLLSAHAAQFSDHVFNNSEDLYKTLSNYVKSSNRELQKIAFVALVEILKQIANMLPAKIEDDYDSARNVFNFLMENFKDAFLNTADSRRIRIAVVGYGYFAGACKILKDEDEVKAMFFKVIQMSDHFFFSKQQNIEEVLPVLPSFLESIAGILKEIDTIPNTMLFSLEKLVVFQIDNYPHVLSAHKYLVASALVKVYLSLYPKADIYKDFLSHTVYQGLVRTCSHLLIAEVEAKAAGEQAEITKSVANPRVKMITYKSYLPLWSDLLEAVHWKEFTTAGVSLAERQSVKESLYSEIISTILNLFDKLDLSIGSKDNMDADEAVEAEAAKDSPSSDPVHGFLPSNVNDCRVFVNVVDFCRDFLISKSVELFEKWVYVFARETIHCATKYPFISGFYKLVALNLNICSKIDYFKDIPSDVASNPAVGVEDENERVFCLHLFSKFSKEVLVHMQQFKDDLLASCLLVVLALPIQIVKNELHLLVPALQHAFKLGLSYLPLAEIGLDALQRWCRDIPNDEMTTYYPEILPLLNQYLIASRLQDENAPKMSSQSGSVLRRKSHKMSAKSLKSSKDLGTEMIEDSELTRVQLKIIRFLGALGGQHNKSMLEHASQKATASAIAWDFHNRNHLKYAVPFPDMKPEIYFDDFLPRVLELATTASDRKVKVAACEVLHSLVLYVIGTGSQLPASGSSKNTMEELYKHLVPGLLLLACDVDQVTKQLFHPLLIQLTHWFSHSRTINTPEAHIILQCFWDGATNSENAALRDFSAICLKEFFQWSLKQSPDTQEKLVKGILKKIYSFAIHPSMHKRLGAALVFNNIYTVFRNEEVLVKTYTLELLVKFVDSLAIAHGDEKLLGTQKLCVDALKHIERILVAKSQLFIKENAKCRKPECFGKADLKSAVIWLLHQCGNVQTECRHVCMELVVKLSSLPGMESMESLLRNVNIVEEIFECKIRDFGASLSLKSQTSWKTLLHWMQALVTSLECFNWAVSVHIYPSAQGEKAIFKEYATFKASSLFLEKIALYDLKSVLDQLGHEGLDSLSLSPKEILDFNWSKCCVLVRLFNFFVTLSRDTSCSILSKAFKSCVWNEKFWEVIILSVVDPVKIGFDVMDGEVAKNLAADVSTVLGTDECHEYQFQKFCSDYLKMKKKYDIKKFFPVDFSQRDADLIKLGELLRGYSLLLHAKLWPEDVNSEESKTLAVDIWNNVWCNMTGSCREIDSFSDFTPCAFRLAKQIVSFVDDLGITVQDVICKLMDTACSGSESKSAKKGLLGFLYFEEEISLMLCKRLGDFVPALIPYTASEPLHALTVLLKFLSVVATKRELRKKYGKRVLELISDNWSRLCSCWDRSTSVDILDTALSIMTNMILIDSEIAVNSSQVYSTSLFDSYIKLLGKSGFGFDFKVRALDLLPFFLDDSEEKSESVKSNLNEIIVSHFPVSSSELVRGSSQYNLYVSAIEKMLSAFQLTGSVVLLEILTILFCSEDHHIMEEEFQKCLASLTKSLPVHKHQRLAEVTFKLTDPCTSTLSPAAQFAVMDRVCLSIMSSIGLSAFINFYESNINKIMDTLKCRKSSDPITRKVQLVAKIGAFKLMQLLYTRLTKTQVHSVESQVVRAFVKDKPQTGKELTTEVMKVALEFKKEEIKAEDELQDLHYKYCCASFNTLVAVISCTQNELKFYNGFIFKENQIKGERTWENLVNPAKEYKFDIELDEPLKRQKRFVAIRHHVRSFGDGEEQDDDDATKADRDSSLHLMASQHLAMSSLAEDVSKFDFSTSEQVFSTMKKEMFKNDSSVSSREEKKEYIYMEADELNEHECMAPLSSLFKHMDALDLIPKHGDSAPEWLKTMILNLENPDVNKNVKLFLVRVITNNAEILKGCGKYLLSTLMKLIASGCLGTELNYFILDAIIAMLSWAPEVVPEDNAIQRYDAKVVLQFLIDHCGHTRKDIFRNNLEVIKTVLECWKDRIDVPYSAIYEKIMKSDLNSKESVVGMQLLGVVLTSNLPPYPMECEKDWVRRLDVLVYNLRNKYKEVYATAAEVIGLILNYKVGNDPGFKEEQYSLYQRVNERLHLMKADETDKFILCLHIIHKHFPQIVKQFFNRILFLQPAVHGSFQNYVLEMLCSCVKEIEDGYKQLKITGLFSALENKEESSQYILLQTLERVVSDLSCDEILYLLPVVIPVHSQPAPQCRLVLYKIMMLLYDKYSAENGAKEEEIVRLSQETLLKALADPDITLRLTVDNFWSSEQHLPLSTKEKLIALMKNMYSPPTEYYFLQYATFLLLERTSHSPDYKRKIFEHPLSECNFLAYSIATSWRQRYAVMTPLFVDSASSSLGVGMGSLDGMAPQKEMLVKATQQQGDFSETLDSGFRSSTYNWLVEKNVDTFADSSMMETSSSLGSASASSHILTSRRVRKVGNVQPRDLSSTKLGEKEEKTRSHVWLLKKRFMKDKKVESDTFARIEMRRKDAREDLRKEQKKRREAEVTMYRQYRIGELPDIEIPNSAIIAPLQALAQSDHLVAKQLFKSLVVAVCDDVAHNDEPDGCDMFREDIGNCMWEVLQKSYEFVPSVISFCLESLHEIGFIGVDPEHVYVASLNSNQQSMGILLMESQIIKGEEVIEPRKKKARVSKEPIPKDVDRWMKLAGLHKSVNDYDVVNGIFSHIMGEREVNKKVLALEARGQYAEALKLYSQLYETTSEEENQAEKDFWDNSILFCYDKLTQWSDLEETAVSRFTDPGQPDLQKVWEEKYLIDNYLPYVIRAKVKLLIEGSGDQSLLSFVDEAKSDEEKRIHIEEHYINELALLYVIQKNLEAARHYGSSAFRKFLKDWSSLSPLAISVQQLKLQDLQKCIELEEFLNVARNDNAHSVSSSMRMIERWQKRLPSVMDPINVWDDVIANRQLYLRKLKQKHGGVRSVTRGSQNGSLLDDSQSMEVEEDMEQFYVENSVLLELSFIRYCTAQGNIPVALRHLKNIREDVKRLTQDHWSTFIEVYCIANNQRALKICGEEKVKILLNSYSQLEKIGAKHQLRLSQQILKSEISELMCEAFGSGEVSLSTLSGAIQQKISAMTGESDNSGIIKDLHEKSFSSLKEATRNLQTSTERKETGSICRAHMCLANFCNKYLRQTETGHSFIASEQRIRSTYPDVLTKSLLSALRHGDKQAMQLFPRLLQVIEMYPEVMPVFVENTSSTPCWMFIGWINQMVAVLDKPEASAVQGIVESIVQEYPMAIVYAFLLSYESYNFLNTMDGKKSKCFVEKIKQELKRHRLVMDFIDALHHLSVPHVLFRDYISKIVQVLTKPAKTQAVTEMASLIKQMEKELFDLSHYSNVPPGPIQKDFARSFGKEFKKICGDDGGKLFSGNRQTLVEGLKKMIVSAKSQHSKLLKRNPVLKSVSPWLSEFQPWKYDTQIEIPGQYTGKTKPLPEFHVKVAGFDEKLLVLTSLTQPYRITIRGNDEREYKVLVKSGEDLRQDNRLQQLFTVMNEIYSADPDCGSRQLKLATYRVIPISSRLGMIEWVDNTVVLNEFLMNSMTEKEEKAYKKSDNYMNVCQEKLGKWLKGKNPTDMYRNIHLSKSREDTVKKFDEIVSLVPRGLLKRAFLKLSSSPEAYLRLRSEFAKSHALICISQWLLGIGDRHLGNFLIDLMSGQEVGIDFGHAFGSATQFLPIPELVPFRLTPQYVQLMEPLKEKGIIEATMVHALNALQKSRYLLLNVMDVFIKEPTVDWKANAEKQKQEIGLSEEEVENDTNWYPKQRVKIAERKLQGHNPCHVMRTELELGHGRSPVFENFKSACLGTPEFNIRAKLGSTNLTVEEQVSCLIDQATDANILCKTYFGWNPWM